MHGMKKVLLSWSSGKDSTWALHLLRAAISTTLPPFLLAAASKNPLTPSHAPDECPQTYQQRGSASMPDQ